MEFEGDVESVFCRDFVASYDSYGHEKVVPLKANGENIRVTGSNREEYVRLYVDFMLNRSVAKQFESFKKGFLHVCGGNALSVCSLQDLKQRC